MFTQSRASFKAFLCAILTTGFFCLGAAYNGFPVFYPDSISYLYSAYFLEFRGDRPVFYSLWLAVGYALFNTFWFAVVAQSLVTSLLIRWVLMLHGIRRLNLFHCLACTGLGLLTGIWWQTARIMPDAFTAIMALSFYLMAFGLDNISRARAQINAGILVLCLLVHYSHLVILLLVLLCIWACRLMVGNKFVRRPPRELLFCVLGALALTFFANKAFGLGYLYSKNPYAFLLSRMVQDGSVGVFLEENCHHKSYIFCDNRAYVTQQTVAGFLWGESGPFRQPVGQADAYRDLIFDMFLSDPRGQFGAVMKEFGLQLLKIGSGDSLESFPEGTWEIAKLRIFSPGQMIYFERSKQQAGELSAPVFLLNNVYYLSFWASCIFLLGFYFKQRADWRKEMKLAIVAGFFLVANAFVCGALSVAVDRYQSRVVWLPVFVVLVILARWVERRIDA